VAIKVQLIIRMRSGTLHRIDPETQPDSSMTLEQAAEAFHIGFPADAVSFRVRNHIFFLREVETISLMEVEDPS